jgi:hypothetical protein
VVSGRKSSPLRVILLAESLQTLVQGLDPSTRYPALQRVLGHSFKALPLSNDMDRTRFELFGLNATGPLPLAAIRRLGELPENQVESAINSNEYWLAADPVTLRAGMTRLMLVSGAHDRLNREGAAQLARVVSEVLSEEGLELESAHHSHWYVALREAPGFDFMPPHEALGADMADVLPQHENAASWKVLMNRIQMALHAHPLNERLRELGHNEVNSVWFWGGGTMPQRACDDFGAAAGSGIGYVLGEHPITAGLTCWSGLRTAGSGILRDQRGIGGFLDTVVSGFDHSGDGMATILVDWQLQGNEADHEAERLEAFMDEMLSGTGARPAVLEIHSQAATWNYKPRRLKKFWQKERPLQDLLQTP